MKGLSSMKSKKYIIPILFSILLITSCKKQPASSMADYIGIDAAKTAALKAADVPANQAAFSTAGLDKKDGAFFYQIVFTENGTEHRYAIDALTGLIIEESHNPLTQATTSLVENETSFTIQETPVYLPPETSTILPSAPIAENIDANTALSIALTHAGISANEVSSSETDTEYEHGKQIFEVEFTTLSGVEYDYKINAADGTVISFDYNAESLYLQAPSPNTGMISEAQAKQAVLDRVPQALAEHIFIELDEDDGRFEYEGSLIYNNIKYEFKIDAYSGGIIEWEAKLQNH